MDNENKKMPESNGAHKKNRRQKSKGYFITPNQNKDDKNVKNEKPVNNSNNKPSENKNPSQSNDAGATQKNAQRGNEHHHNRRRNGNRHHNKEQNANRVSAEQPKATQNNENRSEEQRPVQANQNERPRQKHHQKHGRSGAHSNDQKSTATLLNSLADTAETNLFVPKEPEKPIDPSEIPSDILETPLSVSIPVEEDESEKVEIVGIRFKSSGKIYYFDPQGKHYSRAGHAIVETSRGQEYGEIAMGNTFVKKSEVVPPLRPVVRAATQADEEHHLENHKKEDEAFKICNEKIAAHGLDMKLIDAQYTFDNSKLLFYFTSAGRVDFRELVKDLASVFRTRIELRQIGIRDEARIMGGLGLCGRPLCCSLFLNDFGQVSIKMAKEQNLSLNSAKISGICGRLMCCLRYEHETYEHEIKLTPPVDSLVETPDGKGTVTETSPLAATVKVRLIATPDAPPKVYKRDDLVVLKVKEKNPNDED